MFDRRTIVPFCVAACTCNALFAGTAGYDFSQDFSPVTSLTQWLNPIALVCGALASVIALALAIALVEASHGPARVQAKSAVALLLLSPFAWWTLVWPAMLNTTCIGRGCYGAEATAFRRSLLLDIDQAQFAIAIIACVALFMAIRSARAPMRVYASGTRQSRNREE
ncbi:hypothetical protein [Terricaulis silvestris]|uniref:Methylamine utilization protein MauE n=1 Tax=Terricaulis silvestris TaxID=2686094 RepID=A0A6I6MR98_9CAUL|nr:hypothetical protein [Terricaulis silvestris]QGZ94142.1 hypothetical protein DSM104635_00958 [Terricaulis silvestris]